MKTHKPLKVVAVVLSVLMLFSAVPMTAFAAWADDNVVYDGSTFGTNDYYNVISKKDYTLVPGAATETEMVINNADGNRRQVMHVLECDPSNPDISIVPGYYNIDKDITDVNNWTAAGMTDMAAKYENELGYNVVCGMNTALAYDNNAPYSYLVYNGQVLVDRNNNINNYHSGYCQTMLCVYKDAQTGACSCELRTASQGLRGDEWQAIGANFGMVVNNGQLVSKTEERTSSAAARSMIGVKEDGTLVLVMNDGRGANNSVGFCNYELGESMLALGCKWAFNCDGGGSSGFVSKRAGETEVTMRSVPCDGAERPTINGVFIVSNVGPTGELNNVNINSDYDYFAPGTTYTFSSDAIDTHGYAMDVPADATWALSDASFGTVNNGTFTSNGTTGDVDVQVISGGNVVGTKTIHIANPTTLNLSAAETTLPYSTPAKVRTTNLPMVAKIGENDVFTAGAYNISVSPANGGTVDGLKFTATDDTSVSQAVVTINYAPTNQSFTYTVNYGKGSEVLWDYEDGDISAWTGTDETDQYMRDHGAEIVTYGDFTTPFKTLAAGGQISWSNKTTTKLSSVAEGGIAHGGDKALAVTFDMKNVEFNSWVYSIIWNTQGNTVLRDVANGNNATAIGCWVYIPKGFYTVKNNGAQALQLTVQKGPNANTLSGTQLNLQYNGKNINALKESDIPENRWVYVKASLTANNYVKLVDPVNDVYRSASIMRMYVKPSEAQEMTYYFDDWTLDYSSAVDDREPPVISNPTYCTNDTNIDFDDQTITTNTVSFNANVADYAASNAEGLDYDSAMIYVDGVAQRNVSASGNTMGVQNVVLSNGVHNIKFEIADKLGNSTTLTKALTVNADGAKPAVRLAGHNDKNNAIETGSVYYVDVKADNIESIDSVTTTIDLQSAHEWELDNIITAPGFEASYELDSIKDNVATVTITKTGATTLTGEQTIASLPVRVWSYDENTLAGGDGKSPVHYTAAQRYASSYGEPVLMMEANVLYGEVGYTDNTAGTFGGSISEATAVTGNKTKAWHEHDAELTVQNKEATCTEDGYTDRTYCETCGSVVDWGTKVPATGHDYELVDGKFVCSVCEDVYQPGTGLFEMNGKTYYAINNKLIKNWQEIDGTWYYFNTSNYAGVSGSLKYGEVTYEMNDDGSLKHGEWYFDGKGYRYYYGPDYYRCKGANPYANTRWEEIDGKRYAFDREGHRHSGISMLIESNSAPGMFEFTEDGVYVGKYETDYTGVFPCNNGRYTYLENGTPKNHGLAEYEGNYYYFNSSCLAVTGTYNCTNHMTALIPPGTYQFDETGKMINPPVAPTDPVETTQAATEATEVTQATEATEVTQAPTEAVKNGIYRENGTLYYYENGAKKQVGLINIDGDWYYVRSGGKVATGTYYCTFHMTNQIPAGSYEFDENGKMLNVPGQAQTDPVVTDPVVTDPVEPTTQAPTEALKNGIYRENGGLYYYVDGARKQVGLINIDGDWYYVRSGGKVATGTYHCTFHMTDQIPAGTYEFDENGKMLNVPGQGETEPAETTTPVVTDPVVTDPVETTTQAPTEAAKNGIYRENGKLYYYENGVKKQAGLIVIDNDYYYIRSGGVVATGTYYCTYKMTNEVPAGTYTFDDEGKMLNPPVPAYKDGFVNIGDGIYYYKDNVLQKDLGIIVVDGSYYYVKSNGQLATGQYSVDYNTHDYIRGGKHQFGEDGKMVVDPTFLVGIRGGRDIAYLNQTSTNVKVKPGMIFRGSELDGAYYSPTYATITEEDKQNGVALLTEKGVVFDMDLRAQNPQCEDVLGVNVPHKYYDMVSYDEIFTESGKAKVKEIFTDLANPDNYPLYCHCTYGLDRTGTVCYLVEALLGFSDWNLSHDYCGTIRSHEASILKIKDALIENYEGSNRQEQVTNYLLSCGVTQEQINTIRDLLIDSTN